MMRALRSVGMTAFVAHMALWESRQDAATAAETLHLTTGWQPTACRTRVNYARAILKAGLRRAALERVAGRLAGGRCNPRSGPPPAARLILRPPGQP